MSTINSTVKFCKRCQTETERTKRGRCKPCEHARLAEWYKANPEKQKANAAAWRKANSLKNKEYQSKLYAADPEKSRARSRAWAQANPERIKALSAKTYAANKEAIKEKTRAWAIANSDRAKATAVAWRKANPEACKINSQNRRALKAATGGKLSKGLSAKLFKLQHGKCACCGLPLGDNFHLDHIFPVALGGPNTDDNIQLLRQHCNLQKHTKHPIDFMRERGFLL